MPSVDRNAILIEKRARLFRCDGFNAIILEHVYLVRGWQRVNDAVSRSDYIRVGSRGTMISEQ
jgi:hypothetical protein